MITACLVSFDIRLHPTAEYSFEQSDFAMKNLLKVGIIVETKCFFYYSNYILRYNALFMRLAIFGRFRI